MRRAPLSIAVAVATAVALCGAAVLLIAGAPI